MRGLRFTLGAAAVLLALALRRWRRRSPSGARRRAPRAPERSLATSDVALVISRELRERLRSRFYVVGTVITLLVVSAAIVIPVLKHSSTPRERIGVVGTLSPAQRASVETSVRASGATVRYVTEASLSSARADLETSTIDFALVDGAQLLVRTLYAAHDFSATALAVRAVALRLGEEQALAAAHLSAAQSAALSRAAPLSIVALRRGTTKSVNATSLVGVILIFIMLSQYNTWILIGVMEEKSSRVIEVLLATVRPIRLLAGKVIGIGLAALLQAFLIVAYALVLSKVVGSSLIHGTGPLEVASTLVWLVLGYALYCWVYAAAGSMAQRQDQVQSLALPLSLPMIVGYVVALTGASAGTPSLLVKILAYVPLTAPFDMPVLVGAGAVTWWQFTLSVLLTLVTMIGVARVASGVYRRAILRTGSRIRWRDVRRSAPSL